MEAIFGKQRDLGVFSDINPNLFTPVPASHEGLQFGQIRCILHAKWGATLFKTIGQDDNCILLCAFGNEKFLAELNGNRPRKLLADGFAHQCGIICLQEATRKNPSHAASFEQKMEAMQHKVDPQIRAFIRLIWRIRKNSVDVRFLRRAHPMVRNIRWISNNRVKRLDELLWSNRKKIFRVKLIQKIVLEIEKRHQIVAKSLLVDVTSKQPARRIRALQFPQSLP